MDVATLQSKTRKRHIVQARQLAMYLCKKIDQNLTSKHRKSNWSYEIMLLFYMHVKRLIT